LFWRNTLASDHAVRADLTLMSYGSGWNGSGQIPLRAVEDGMLGRFGSVDPTEGGYTQRHSAMLRARGASPDGRDWDMAAYLVHYDFSLFSNFGFFAGDSVNGDQIGQTDRRAIAGFRAETRDSRVALGLRWNTTLGAS